jgi:pimeloyl-ACP methyl ester carboxylesterase
MSSAEGNVAVGAVVDRLAKPFVIVGQSIGAPITELVAAARPDRPRGLVLPTPVPLAGMRPPDAVVEPFRALGGDAEAQRGARRQLSVGLAEAAADRLVTSGLAPAAGDGTGGPPRSPAGGSRSAGRP